MPWKITGDDYDSDNNHAGSHSEFRTDEENGARLHLSPFLGNTGQTEEALKGGIFKARWDRPDGSVGVHVIKVELIP